MAVLLLLDAMMVMHGIQFYINCLNSYCLFVFIIIMQIKTQALYLYFPLSFSLQFRLWKGGSLCSHVLEGHSGAITSVCILKENSKCFNIQIFLFPITVYANVAIVS